ncbi:MAG: hypothetical protein WC655_24255 [Candidatus Hydrogenedentales bacterium]
MRLLLTRFCYWNSCVAVTLAGILASFALSANAAESAAMPPDMSPAVIAPDLPMGEPVRGDLDQYGGWTGLKGQKTGFFHVETLGGRTWFVTPEGNAYFWLQMGWAGDLKDVPRLKSWGFNSAEKSTGLPYEVNVNFFRMDGLPELPVGRLAGLPPWVSFPDVFAPEWPQKCEEQAKRVLGPIANDPLLVGYFMVNEISMDGWYEAVTHTAKDAPARAAFVEVARAYYADKPDALAQDWKAYSVTKVEDIMNVEGDVPSVGGLKDAWIAAVAERGFGTAARAAKAVAPNHLNLGTRMINAPLPHPAILKSLGAYCDVISMNLYNMLPDRVLTQVFTIIPAIAHATGRPTMTTEISFRGGDTLHPNTMGALPTVKTQAERGVGYLSYVAAVASIPTHLGISWYKYPDDDLEKEWDEYAEDCNFGVIDPQGRPYSVLTETMRATNSLIYELAADPVKNPKRSLFWRTELLRWDLALDSKLLGRMARSDEPFNDPLAQFVLGKEPVHFDSNYWIRHQSPTLLVNDERFVGWCQANMHKTGPDGERLVLINVQSWTNFPRSLWFGGACENPDKLMAFESNAQFLERKLDTAGRVMRLTMADASFIRINYDQPEVRLDCRVPYIDLKFDHDAKQVTITARGSAKRLGVAGLEGWKATWNGVALPDANVVTKDKTTVFTVAN